MIHCEGCDFNKTDLHKTHCCGPCCLSGGERHAPMCSQIRRSYSTIMLQCEENEFGPYRLYEAVNGAVVFNANYKKDHMTFLMVNRGGHLQQGRGGSSNAHFVIDSSGNIRQSRGGKYLTVQYSGLVVDTTPTKFIIRSLDGSETIIEEMRRHSKKPEIPDVSTVFTPLHAEQLLTEGYCILRSAVHPWLVTEALREINSHLIGGNSADNFGLAKSPHLLNLVYNSSISDVLKLLLGDVEVLNGCQVALRPPEPAQVRKSREGIPLPEDIGNGRWHIDGQGKNGVHSPFTNLVGICLSDVDELNCGNFTVWPGSHLKMLDAIREHQTKFGTSTPLFSKWRPDMGPSKQLLMKKGDVVIAHQKLCHQGGPNASSNIRYQVYYRVSCEQHADNVNSGKCLNDLWTEFPGLHKYNSNSV